MAIPDYLLNVLMKDYKNLYLLEIEPHKKLLHPHLSSKECLF
jgi:hypothetical protein